MYTTVEELAQKENIHLEYELMTREQSEYFISLMLALSTGQKLDLEPLRDSNSIYGLAYKRYKAFNMEDKFEEECLLFVDLFAKGVPGRAVLILIDLLNLHEKLERKVTTNDISRTLYPNGFYTPDTVIKIVDGYVKTGKLNNFEIY